ncbi:MAG: DsbA family protein [Spirochaetes bacterium]|nr:DsbA family protein [Spirochaetota bacterium]
MAEIIYVFDGYCGWCWGINEVIGRLKRDFNDRFRFRAVSGGLVVGSRIGPLGDFADYIARAIPRVEEMTGAIFSEPHRTRMRDKTTMQDSRVPAAAFAFALAASPQSDSVELAHDILALNFKAGADISLAESYTAVLQKYGADAARFVAEYKEGKLFALANEQFAFAREIGADSFPTIVYARDGHYFPLCQGFQKYENLAHALDVLHREPPELGD